MFSNFLWNCLLRKLHYHKKHLEIFKTVKFWAYGLFPAPCFPQPGLEQLSLLSSGGILDQDCFDEVSQGLIYVLTKATTCKEAVCLPSLSAGWRFLLHRCCSRRHRVIQLQDSQRAERAKIWPGQSSVLCCHREALSFHVFESCS